MFGQKRIPSREGGVEIVVEELCTRMVAQGHNVTCYNTLLQNSCRKVLLRKISILCLWALPRQRLLNCSLQLSIPLIGYALAAQVLNVSDRMMISRMVDNSAVGIYSTLYTVSSISLLVWSAINASFIPYLYQNIESDKNEIKKYSLLLI